MKKCLLCLTVIMLSATATGFAKKGKTFDAHATAFSYFFHDQDMDFHFGSLFGQVPFDWLDEIF